MLKFIIKRILSIVPTLLIVIGIIFILYQYLPGDPVESVYSLPLQKNNAADSIAYQQQYDIYYKALGLDKPLFFFSLSANKGIRWHGMDNQYATKVINILKGDFGNSYRTKTPVLQELANAIRWTLSLNILSLIVIFGLGIFLGLKAALHYDKAWDKNIMKISFILDAVPTLWLATLLVVFFTTNYYGMKIFPSIGLGDPPADLPFIVKLGYALPHFILPIICMTLGSISMIIRQMRASALTVINQDYIKTGIAKGLNQKQLVKKHIFPNAIFPIITLIGATFPSLIAGSVLIENIFNIPGMGKLSIEAILNKDFPILTTVVILTAILTIVGNILADVLYRIFNPKVEN
jgi:peptide/nickel transport system permease protein